MKKQIVITLNEDDKLALLKASQIMYEVSQALHRNLFECKDMTAIVALANGHEVAAEDLGNLTTCVKDLGEMIKGEE